MRRTLAFLGALAALAIPALALAQPAPTPAAAAESYAPFAPMIGKTWRGTGTGAEPVEDIQTWDWAVGGHAVRIVHSVNGGDYGGETLIFRDKDSGDYIFHYFTSGGFHTTGTIRPTAPGRFEIDETVHGVDDLEALRSTGVMGEDGVYRVRSRVEKDGAWIEVGGFDYRQDPTATVVMPVRARAASEAAVTLGALELSRRLVRGVDQAGEDVAGYLKVANRGAAPDRLIGASCACAERIELHRIDRSGPRPDMVSDPGWDAPFDAPLDVRPGSDLHLMLIGYDPAKAVDGKVRLTLTFRDAGPVEADFALVEDSPAAWTAFD